MTNEEIPKLKLEAECQRLERNRVAYYLFQAQRETEWVREQQQRAEALLAARERELGAVRAHLGDLVGKPDLVELPALLNATMRMVEDLTVRSAALRAEVTSYKLGLKRPTPQRRKRRKPRTKR